MSTRLWSELVRSTSDDRPIASYSAVPDCPASVIWLSAVSASIVAVERPLSSIGRRPNSTTAIASGAGFAATKLLAAAAAAVSGLPAIDCESSTASTTAFARPRFSASSPTTRWPFSVTTGVAEAPADETTLAWIVGYELVSTPPISTPAAAGAAATSAAAATARSRTRPLIRRLRTAA